MFYIQAWKALIDAQNFGLIKTIGVSNFLPEHLDRIIELTEEDIKLIDSLDKGESGRVEGQHPNEYEEFD